jgi:hypothetical protein
MLKALSATRFGHSVIGCDLTVNRPAPARNIDLSGDGEIALLRLSRPRESNALGVPTFAELEHAGPRGVLVG